MSEELARKLKEARKKLGLTQKEASTALGIPLGTLIHWENNQSHPGEFALRAVLEKLDAILSAPPPSPPTKKAATRTAQPEEPV